MKNEITWLKDALVAKELVPSMACYCIQGGEIKATNGCVVAGHPFDSGKEEALIPGTDLEKILSKLEEGDEPRLKFTEKSVVVTSGSFRAVIPILSVKEWNYAGPEAGPWRELPPDLISALARIRPFISDNASQPWATCAHLSGNHVYATNNIVAVGSPVPDLGRVNFLLPHWAVDFIIKRPGVTHWQLGERAVSFKWENGAWLRSALMQGVFPTTAIKLVEEAEASKKTTQVIDADFRKAFNRLGSLVEGGLDIFADKMSGKFRGTLVEEKISCQVPHGLDKSRWAPEFLAPVIAAADLWSPSEFPNPAKFRGEKIAGVIAGRTN